MSSADPVSHLLNAPKEIRLMIYRLLLLPQNLLPMGPIDSEVDDWSDMNSDEDEEMGIIDIDFDSPGADTDVQNEMTIDSGDSSSRSDFSLSMTDIEAFPYTKEDYASCRRYPAILRTNRQIYSEASSLLYTEGTLVIEPADVFALASRHHNLEFGVPADDTWRYHPLKDPGQASTTGEIVYSTSPNMDGYMLPHVFHRFQRIYFDACFESEHTENIELWIDDESHVVRKEDADAFKGLLRNASFMKDFVNLIARSPLITKLEIILEVEVMASSNLMTIDTEDEDDEGYLETEHKVDRLEDVANERATELFLDSGVCEPLLALENVMTFDLNFGFDDRDDEEKYQPLPQHAKMLEGMKRTIEANFKAEVTDS